jgi:hypothetical protein
MEYVAAAERSVKCKAQSPIDNFEKLVEAACPDHAYPIKHKLKNCDMVRNFMTSRSLTRGKEPEEDQGRKGMTPPPPQSKVSFVFISKSLEVRGDYMPRITKVFKVTTLGRTGKHR